MAPPSIQIVIAGNKCDMERLRKVDKAVAADFAKEMGASHFLTSAKMGDGVKEVFADLTRRAFLVCRGLAKDQYRSGPLPIPPLASFLPDENASCAGIASKRGEGGSAGGSSADGASRARADRGGPRPVSRAGDASTAGGGAGSAIGSSGRAEGRSSRLVIVDDADTPKPSGGCCS